MVVDGHKKKILRLHSQQIAPKLHSCLLTLREQIQKIEILNDLVCDYILTYKRIISSMIKNAFDVTDNPETETAIIFLTLSVG